MNSKRLVALLALALAAGLALTGCAPKAQPKMNTIAERREAQEGPKRSLEEKMKDLKVEDIVVGKGLTAKPGMAVMVHYKGMLEDGTVFDENQEPEEPFSFILGTPGTIEGFDLGIQGMNKGGTRKITIPSDLAYGSKGEPRAGIPENATLIFEVELVDTFDLIK